MLVKSRTRLTMETSLPLLIFCFVVIAGVGGMSTVLLTPPQRHSSCGSWIPYTDEKCLRVADIAAFLTKQEADAICPMFAEMEALDDVPRLVTIKNEREQKALKQFLFEELGLLDQVWLDADVGNDGIFKWNNESEMYFTNLVEQNVTSTDRQCLQIESGQGIYPLGKWSRVNCRKRNVVVCEKTQVWTVAQLQNSFLDFKTKIEQQTEKPRLISGNEVEAQVKPERILEKSAEEDSSLHQSPCGDWTPYKDEKCVKLIVKSGTQMKEDADVVCQGLKEFWDPETIPHLVTVKTKEKQKFLEQLLFEKQTTFDHVWLGLEFVNDTLLRWDDGTELFFTNWAKQGAIDQGRNCVQMESGEGVYKSGQWVKTNCRRRNAVVCEKTQTWTVTRLQNILLSLKLDVERNRRLSEETLFASKQESERKLNQIKEEAEAKMSANRRDVEQTIKHVKQEAELKISAVKQEAEQKINAAKQESERKISANKAESERTLNAFKQETDGKIRAAEAKTTAAKQDADQKINNLVKNPVPVGFIYVQLPDQPAPRTLWPQSTWQDVSASYAGLFFRAAGGNAAAFGQVQNENAPRLAIVEWTQSGNGGGYTQRQHAIPSSGWSGQVFSGDLDGKKDMYLRFQLSSGEVRPRNKDVLIWKRTA